MQGTSGNDVFSLTDYTDNPSLLDGGDGFDRLNLTLEYVFTTLDFTDPSIPQIFYNYAQQATTIVNIEQVVLTIYGFGQAHIIGNGAGDTLNGGSLGDYLDGGNGNDFLFGGGSWSEPDTVIGGQGHDTIGELGTGETQDIFTGGTESDLFMVGEYDPILQGRIQYNDTVTDFEAGHQGDVIAWSAQYQSDYWIGKLRLIHSGSDVLIQELLEGPATDSHVMSYDYAWSTLVTLRNVAFSSLVNANFSQAVELTDARDDTMRGTDNPDLMNGGFGDDDLLGRGGSDRLNGAQGHDTLNGASGDDTITGGYGNDLVFGGDGRDIIQAGFENDKVFGDAGNDRIFGDQGDDTLSGGAGDDLIDGGRGQDRLYGNAGNDTLVSGPGNDVLRGDQGHDVFVISEALYGNWDANTVLDFTLGEDRLDLRPLGLLSFDQIAPLIENDADGHATIFVWTDYFGPAERVTLLGVDAAELSARDFVLGG